MWCCRLIGCALLDLHRLKKNEGGKGKVLHKALKPLEACNGCSDPSTPFYSNTSAFYNECIYYEGARTCIDLSNKSTRCRAPEPLAVEGRPTASAAAAAASCMHQHCPRASSCEHGRVCTSVYASVVFQLLACCHPKCALCLTTQTQNP